MSTLIQLSGGGSINPTSGVFPVNDGGVFVDSTLSWVNNFPGFGQIGLKSTINPSTGSLYTYDLFTDLVTGRSSLGLATTTYMGAPYADSGIATDSGTAEAIIGAGGVSSPYYGVFRASGANALIEIGTSFSNSVGINTAFNSFHIGSNLNSSAPVNPATPVQWIIVSDDSFNFYRLPLYQ